MAYEVDAEIAEDSLRLLDVREKNGYERHETLLHFANQRTAPGLVYIAPQDNHAFLGPAPLHAMAAQIRECAGPSGRNADYLFDLADALRNLNVDDPHVFELESAVRREAR
jgi:cation transport regulator ChaC